MQEAGSGVTQFLSGFLMTRRKSFALVLSKSYASFLVVAQLPICIERALTTLPSHPRKEREILKESEMSLTVGSKVDPCPSPRATTHFQLMRKNFLRVSLEISSPRVSIRLEGGSTP